MHVTSAQSLSHRPWIGSDPGANVFFGAAAGVPVAIASAKSSVFIKSTVMPARHLSICASVQVIA